MEYQRLDCRNMAGLGELSFDVKDKIIVQYCIGE
jgi:hypothetical protein